MIVTLPVAVGIGAGALVFIGTILTVIILLVRGGSFERMKQEAIGMPNQLGELKPQLYDELLETAKTRALKPAALESPLVGKFVIVDNYAPKYVEVLHAISNGEPREGIYRELSYDADDMLWRYLDHGPFASAAAFEKSHCVERDDNWHFVIFDAESREPIGMISLGSHSPKDLRIEICDLWFTPSFQGTVCCKEVVLLMLQHLFNLKYRRVEWRCDGHNVRARRAAHSLGFLFEGVLRKHRIVKECNQDTVVFAALNSDWTAIRDQLVSNLETALAEIEKEKAKEKKMA